MGDEKQHNDNEPSRSSMSNAGNPEGHETAKECLSESEQEAYSYPCMYQVILLNDDFTPMDFVTGLLEQVFHVPPLEARSKMLQVHHDGQAICGIYTHDVAETKVIQVMDTATHYHYPLKCIMRKETRYAVKKS